MYRKKWKIGSDDISKVIIFAFEMLSVAQTGNMSIDNKVVNDKGCGRNHPFSDLR
jgi:hypothetical protein